MDSTGMFFADPQFINVGQQEFDLESFSPAINAGSRSADLAPYRTATDTSRGDPPDGVWASQLTCVQNQSLDEAIVDLGFHHLPENYTWPPLPINEKKLSVFPNPYNGNGVITFILPNLPYYRTSSAQIFDLQGRCVKTLKMPDEPLHEFHLNWEASNIPSGNYFFVLNVDGKKYQRKFIILR